MDIAATGDTRGPCSGITVLEFSSMLAGPLCGQNLGDLGADVIKIESAGGDTARRMVPPWREGLTGFFAQLNRNKRSLVLDLKSDEGKAIVRQLVARADVVLENYRIGVMDRLGLGYDALREINPRLVYVAISGFGPDGPYANLPVYDLVIQGMSGMMWEQAVNGEPRMFRSVMADKCVAITAASATLAALLARERHGVGQRVDVPMLDAYAQLTLPDLICTESFQPREDFESNMPDLYRTWKTADGFVVGITIEDHQFAGLCRGLECEHLLDDPRFQGVGARFAHYAALIEALQAEIVKWPTDEMIRRARANDAPFAPVLTVAEFLDDPQVAHNRTVFRANDPQGGEALYIRHPGHYAETPATLRRHPPRLGEHTDDILRELGYTDAQMQGLRERQVVG